MRPDAIHLSVNGSCSGGETGLIATFRAHRLRSGEDRSADVLRTRQMDASDKSKRQLIEEIRALRSSKARLERLSRDLTEQERNEQALRASEARLRMLVRTAPGVILCLSPDYRILEFNAEAERVYGCKREEVLGKNYIEMFLPEEVRAGVAEDIGKVLAGEPTRAYENLVKCADGTERLFEWNVDRVLDEQGQPAGIIAVGQDITERKWAENLTVVQRELAVKLSAATELEEGLRLVWMQP